MTSPGSEAPSRLIVSVAKISNLIDSREALGNLLRRSAVKPGPQAEKVETAAEAIAIPGRGDPPEGGDRGEKPAGHRCTRARISRTRSSVATRASKPVG